MASSSSDDHRAADLRQRVLDIAENQKTNDWETRFLLLAEELWDSLDASPQLVQEDAFDAFATLLSGCNDRPFRLACSVIPAFRGVTPQEAQTYTERQRELLAKLYAKIESYKLIWKPNPPDSVNYRLYKAERALYDEIEVARVGLILFDRTDLSVEQVRKIRELLGHSKDS